MNAAESKCCSSRTSFSIFCADSIISLIAFEIPYLKSLVTALMILSLISFIIISKPLKDCLKIFNPLFQKLYNSSSKVSFAYVTTEHTSLSAGRPNLSKRPILCSIALASQGKSI